MRTSLREIRELERFIQGISLPEERLLMEAKMQLDTSMPQKINRQKMAYQLVRDYGREKLREEIRNVEHELFEAPRHQGFRKRIVNLFKR
ncbi:hypothetical protein [Echinicola vietnamensis]|uniref:Uncharacterized protein n=1 Tax=Echinicola vietnamensis (strain DSM 17526 / LMG 23754 / KMM 6221) TaxID=926556 RepID=L0FXW4_ECHVK|nr:hypothetical protein [Echinicola vietnamensis]AGA77893.1 hypothetical protein Echvi_1628 [Echinicola vietnamensis DSM 17526]